MQILVTLKKSLLVLAFGCCVAAAGGSFEGRHSEAIPLARDEGDIERIVDAALRPVITQPGFTGVVIGVRLDGKNYLYFRGDRKTQGNGTPPNSKTLFMLGSVTKTFTATQLALYAERGQVSFGQLFQQNIPDLYKAPPAIHKSKITLEQLATHTAGFRKNSCIKSDGAANTANPPDDVFIFQPEDAEIDLLVPGCESLVPTLLQNKYLETDAYQEYRCQNGYHGCLLISLPGTAHTYSNFAFGLLGLSLAKASSPAGSTWDVALKRDLTAPLLMVDTGIRGQLTAQQLGRRATGHRMNGSAVPDLNPEAPAFPTLAAGGALWSTPNDLMRWMTYTMGEYRTPLASLLSEVLKKRHTFEGGGHPINQPGQTESMALAWEYTPLAPADATHKVSEVVWKGGATPGFNAYVGFIPGKKTGVFIMANFRFSNSYRVNDLGLSILRSLEKM